MSKKIRKEMQRRMIEEARKRSQETLWNPQLPPDQLREFNTAVESYFSSLEEYAKPCSLGRRPRHGESQTQSHFGGAVMWPEGSPWPSTPDGRPLVAVMEVYTGELPFVPEPVAGAPLVQVFLELEMPMGTGSSDLVLPEYSGGAWHVETHENTSGLQPKCRAAELPRAGIAWELKRSFPAYPDNIDLVPEDIEEAFHALPRWSEMAAERTPSFLGLHFGGWPGWLEGSHVGDFAFQLDGSLAEIDLGFDGQLYFGLNGGEWAMAWEIG